VSDHPQLAEWERRHGVLTARVPSKRWAAAIDYHFAGGKVAKVLYWTDPIDGSRWVVLKAPDAPRAPIDASHLPPDMQAQIRAQMEGRS
jgi:hypothetical protein